MERDTERDDERAQRAWEAVGGAVASAIDGASAVVVIGDDPVAAAAVALGAGRAQGARRRVAIGDLVGEVAPLQALVTGDDPHGLVDSFLYGVSLNKIARPARGARNLYILPSGTEPVVAEEIFRNERWRRLAIGFSEVGALLLLVAPANAPGVDALIAQLDGALVVDAATRVPAGARVIATAERPAELRVPAAAETAATAMAPASAAVEHEEPATVAAPASESEVPLAVAPGADLSPSDDAGEADTARAAAAAAAVAGDATAATGVDAEEDDEPRDARWIRRVVAAPPTQVHMASHSAEEPRRAERAERVRRQPTSRRSWAVPAAVAAAVLVIVVGALAMRNGSSGTRTEAGRRAGGGPGTARSAADSTVAAVPNDSSAATDSLRAAGSAARAAAPVSTSAGEVAPSPAAMPAAAAAGVATDRPLPTLTVANPADSAGAASYAVQIVAANTLDGAKAKQRETATGLPAAVVSPMALAPDNTRWFRLTVGAFASRADAAAYASRLHARLRLDVDPSNVVSVPYALLLADRVPRAGAAARVAALNARGLPAYALLQPDGTARIYAGAFETPQQASLLASALTVADINPVVVYRTGRAL